LEEHEALNECGRGYVWHKRDLEDLWDVVQPSHWPEDPPSSSLNAARFTELANRHNLLDRRIVSRMQHGFPGSINMAPGRTVIAYPHVGALREVAAFEASNERDISLGFVSHGQPFPTYWPTIVDPMNIVVQHGKPRCTIDKTMRHSSTRHPEPVPSYNDSINLDEERAQYGEFKLVRVWQLSRAAAILATAGVEVLGGKFDLTAFFRMHGKQRAHINLSGRLFRTGYGQDLRVNFGERDAMDNTGDASNALAFFIKHELARLDKQYPTKAASVVTWLVERLGFADANSTSDSAEGGNDFVWAVLFFFLYYVDDGGLAVINDNLYDTAGKRIMINVTMPDGTITQRQQSRAQLYFEAAMGVANYINHLTPQSKQSPPSITLEFLGVQLRFTDQLRLLSSSKRQEYGDLARSILNSKELPNGALAVSRSALNSLVHKLIHAGEVIPLMRTHLFYLRAALWSDNKMSPSLAIIGTQARADLLWCVTQLEKSSDVGIPFASRFSFPTSADGTIVRYSDASREPGCPASDSGYGAWSVIDGVFVYSHGLWTPHEIEHYSINVLETKAKDMFGVVAVSYARSVGLNATHTLAFTDNTSAESIAERGRTQVEALHALNARRQQYLVAFGVHEATERVTSIDNDIADHLSRARVSDALRFPTALGLKSLRLPIPPAIRSTITLPMTWS